MEEWLGGKMTAPPQTPSSKRVTLQIIQCGFSVEGIEMDKGLNVRFTSRLHVEAI